jgi:putative MATE family efflux protein
MDTERKIILNDSLRKLLFKFSVPAITGLVFSALYNVVDTLYVGHGVGPIAIAGLAIVLPIQILMFAIGYMIGIGSASIISRSLGAKDRSKATLTAGNAMIINTVISILLMVVCYFFMDKMLMFFGASREVLPYSKDYLSIIIFGFIFYPFDVLGNNLIRSEGRPRAAMYSLILGAVLNIILDPVFIFVFRMGVKGAALATVISQIINMIYILAYFGLSKSVFKFNLKMFIPKLKLIWEILRIGFPSFLMSIVDSVIFILFNRTIMHYGSDMHIAIIGIAIRVMDITIMPIIGIAQAFSTIASFNFGAKNYARVKNILKEAIIWTTVISAFSFIVIFGFPGFLLRIFSSDKSMIDIGILPIRIVSLFFITLGIQIVGGTFFQAIGKAIPALILNISRQVIFFIPSIIILPLFMGLNGVWFSMPLSDILSTIMTIIFIFYELKVIRKLQLDKDLRLETN